MTTYGLTPQGFVVKQQATIVAEIQDSLQQAFGKQINLLPRSTFGQIVGIFAEREALLWQLAEAVYASQYPTGAEGTSVDNILALNNLRRLTPEPTTTAPTDTDGVPGLLLFGTAGTVIPAGAIILVTGNNALQFTLDANVTIAAAVNAIQQMTFFGGIPTQGVFVLTIVDKAGQTLTTPNIQWNADASKTKLTWPTSPSSGAMTLNIGGQVTASIPFTANAATVQAAINALTGLGSVTVTGSFASGFSINWGAISQPTTTVQTSTLNQTTTVLNSIQSVINRLHDTVADTYPYSDVTVTGSIAGGLVNFNFGAGTPATGQVTSGAQSQNVFTVPTSTLQDGSVVVNVQVQTQTAGAPAQGVGSASCTADGPNFVAAGFLSTIGSPQSGWTGVTNPLDGITGRNAETDTDALQRRATELSANANGPIQAIAEKVALVQNVVQAAGFENRSLAADQKFAFNGTPSAGYFKIRFSGFGGIPVTTDEIPWNAQATTQRVDWTAIPTSGTWTLTLGIQTTAAIAYNATAVAVQQALRALTGYENVVVSGNYSQGFAIAFGLSPQLPLSVDDALIVGALATTTVSVQSRVNELSAYFLATVAGSYGAGFTIAFNGSAGGQPQDLATIPDNSLTGVTTITVTFGKPGKSFEIVVNDNNGEADSTTIATTIFNSKPAGIETYGNTQVVVEDTAGNSYPINFSRPTQVPIYVTLNLFTDLTVNPSPQFNIGSIPDIQAALAAIINAVKIGGTVIGFGTNGLVGAFNSTPGILNYQLAFGTSPNPTNTQNIELQSEQVALGESFLITVSYN